MINKSRLIETMFELIRIDSPSGEEQQIAGVLIDKLKGFGFSAGLDNYGNVIGRLGENPEILLSAHMDTVEPGRNIEPRVDGDLLVSNDDTILGGDCKAGVASILEGLQVAIETEKLNKSVEVAFTRQEEIGLVGAKNLDYSKILAKEAIVFDGEGPASRITSSSPTHVRFDIDITGRAAHAGAAPENGISAIRIASEIITRLPQGRLDKDTTFNIGVIKGGSVTNAVPEKTVVKGEFRSHSTEALENIKTLIDNAIDDVRNSFKEANIDLLMETQFDAYSITGEEPPVSRVIRSLARIGAEPVMAPSGGGTDGNILRQHGIESVVVGMADHNAHTVREYVSVTELVEVANLCEAILTE